MNREQGLTGASTSEGERERVVYLVEYLVILAERKVGRARSLSVVNLTRAFQGSGPNPGSGEEGFKTSRGASRVGSGGA